VRDVTTTNFGLLIAYVIPGFVTLLGVSTFSPTVASWISSGGELPTVGGFLYVTIASVGAGLTVSTVRWLVIDWIHHRTGTHQPDWDFGRLPERVQAFDVLIEIHYRYYQWYGNMIVAVLSLGIMRTVVSGWSLSGSLMIAAVVALFTAASRDTLRKYYRRVDGVLAADRRNKRTAR